MKGYLLSLTAAAILSSLISSLAPKGSSGRGARIAAGLLVLVAAFLPFGEIDTLESARELVKTVSGDPLRTDFLTGSSRELMASLISGEAETYILDKAQEMGLSLQVEVTASVREYYPVPWAVTLEGAMTQVQQSALSRFIEKELDIPEERQEWKTKENG